MLYFPFYGDGKQEMTKFYFRTFSDTGYGSLELMQPQKGLPKFDKVSKLE